MGLVGPVLFFGILYALWVGIREWRQDDRLAGLLLFSALPLAGLICAMSFTKRVYPNWPLPFYISGLLLLTHLLAHYRIVSQRTTRLIQPGILLSAGITVAAYFHFFGFNFGMDPSLFPTKKLVGWDALAAQVDQLVLQKERETGKRPFVIAAEYQIASEIAFYSKIDPAVFCANIDGRRMNQYDIWDGWENVHGADAIIVLKTVDHSPALWDKFQEVNLLPVQVPVVVSGTTLRTFHFFDAHSYNGDPLPLPERR